MLLATAGAAMIAPVTAALATARVSTPPPPLASLVLAPADLRPGAVVGSQVTTSYGGRELFLRTFKPGARITDAPLLGAVSAAVLDPDTPTAVADYKELNGETQTTQGRLLLAKQWATDFVKGINAGAHGKSKLTLEHTAVGIPAELGPSTLRLPLAFKTSRGTIRMILEVVQADRTLSILELISPFNGRLSKLDATKALAAIQQHLHVAFTVSNTTPPTISGTPTQGQVVAVDEGDWAGAPSTFSYSWARCDATGANCTPIAGATTNRYSVDPADVGSTIRVTVTGANSLSSQQGVSAATAVVS